MTSFIETPRFPDELAAWAQGGRGFQTAIVQTFGGNEYRTATWTSALGMWKWTEALRSNNPNNAYWQGVLRNMFRVCGGRLYAFRFKDFADYKDEGAGVLGTTGLAVAATLAYQMFKNYSVSPLAYQQIIQKPVGSTIQVYDNGVLQTTPGQYSLDATTGIVTFVSQPTVGHALTWKGQFDVPVRFDVDIPESGLETTGSYIDWPTIRVVEVRNF